MSDRDGAVRRGNMEGSRIGEGLDKVVFAREGNIDQGGTWIVEAKYLEYA